MQLIWSRLKLSNGFYFVMWCMLWQCFDICVKTLFGNVLKMFLTWTQWSVFKSVTQHSGTVQTDPFCLFKVDSLWIRDVFAPAKHSLISSPLPCCLGIEPWRKRVFSHLLDSEQRGDQWMQMLLHFLRLLKAACVLRTLYKDRRDPSLRSYNGIMASQDVTCADGSSDKLTDTHRSVLSHHKRTLSDTLWRS